jgi:hypothetical protein
VRFIAEKYLQQNLSGATTQGTLTEEEGSVQLTSSLPCFVKEVYNIFNKKLADPS